MGISQTSDPVSTGHKHISQLQKRILDFLCIMLAVPFLLPALAILALLVRFKLGSPVFFSQERPGLHEEPFLLYKFRTMTDAYDKDGVLLPDGQRLTAFGCLLRRTSLDELPELFNVIRGDMSLVGPRPLLMRYLPYYTSKEQCRHDVLPGITGLAQINGRNLSPWDERLAMDVWYVENWSHWLDVQILFSTVLKVITREGVSADTAEVETDLDQERKGERNGSPSCHENN